MTADHHGTLASTRRALLAGALGAAAASVASAFGRPTPAAADTGQSIILGSFAAEPYDASGVNESNATTMIGTISGIGFGAKSANNSGLYGESLATTGDAPGVVGRSASTSGVGVYGLALASSGTSYGVEGASMSSSGVGVRGRGALYGVKGETDGLYGTGVYGNASVGGGVNYGGYFNHVGTLGSGVYASSTGGTGVHGVSGAGMYAVYGNATSSSGATYGGSFRSSSSAGTGVQGLATAASGTTYGGSFQSDSTEGTGVVALAQAGTGATRGVYGRVDSPNGTAVIGYSAIAGEGDPTPLPKTGVYGIATQDASSRGVRGDSTAGRGVYGQATTGQGVRGYATTGAALFGSTSGLKSGYAIRAIGRVRLDQCAGIATVLSGANTVTVTPGTDLASTSAVTATLLGPAGGTTTVHRVAVDATNDFFTIFLTANATANVKVAWHVFG